MACGRLSLLLGALGSATAGPDTIRANTSQLCPGGGLADSCASAGAPNAHRPNARTADSAAESPRLQKQAVAGDNRPLRPHIFLTMLDDAGYNDIGSYTESIYGPSEHRCEVNVLHLHFLIVFLRAFLTIM